MCAFYAYKILSHPRITPLTYFLRLDDDSSILPPGTCIDPFEYMHAHNLSYAYREKIDDAGWVTRGMWPFVSNYARRHVGVDERMARNGWGWVAGRAWPGGMEYGEDENFPSYRTNFDLIKVPRFLAPDVRAFNQELVSDPMRFYWYRWGVCPLLSFVLRHVLAHPPRYRRRARTPRTSGYVPRACDGGVPHVRDLVRTQGRGIWRGLRLRAVAVAGLGEAAMWHIH